jgi:hypothetical protein
VGRPKIAASAIAESAAPSSADDYAYSQLAYLTDTRGPRLAGSSQAGAAVERVAGQMRALGAVVTEFPNHVAVMESDVGCDHPTGLLLSSTALKK